MTQQLARRVQTSNAREHQTTTSCVSNNRTTAEAADVSVRIVGSLPLEVGHLDDVGDGCGGGESHNQKSSTTARSAMGADVVTTFKVLRDCAWPADPWDDVVAMGGVRKRFYIIDWLIKTCDDFGLCGRTQFMSMQLLDRFVIRKYCQQQKELCARRDRKGDDDIDCSSSGNINSDNKDNEDNDEDDDDDDDDDDSNGPLRQPWAYDYADDIDVLPISSSATPNTATPSERSSVVSGGGGGGDGSVIDDSLRERDRLRGLLESPRKKITTNATDDETSANSFGHLDQSTLQTYAMSIVMITSSIEGAYSIDVNMLSKMSRYKYAADIFLHRAWEVFAILNGDIYDDNHALHYVKSYVDELIESEAAHSTRVRAGDNCGLPLQAERKNVVANPSDEGAGFGRLYSLSRMHADAMCYSWPLVRKYHPSAIGAACVFIAWVTLKGRGGDFPMRIRTWLNTCDFTTCVAECWRWEYTMRHHPQRLHDLFSSADQQATQSTKSSHLAIATKHLQTWNAKLSFPHTRHLATLCKMDKHAFSSAELRETSSKSVPLKHYVQSYGTNADRVVRVHIRNVHLDFERANSTTSLGEGSFGEVYQYFLKKNSPTTTILPIAVAIKHYKLEEAGWCSSAVREFSLMQRLQHPNIMMALRLYVHWQSMQSLSPSVRLVMPLMQGGDLAQYLKSNGPMERWRIQHISDQLFAALQYLHANCVMHRDLKPQNILLDHTGRNIRISDFGMCRVQRQQFADVLESSLTNGVCTIWYRPPELLAGAASYGVSVDLWSAYLVVAEMSSGIALLRGVDEKNQMERIFRLLGGSHAQATTLGSTSFLGERQQHCGGVLRSDDVNWIDIAFRGLKQHPNYDLMSVTEFKCLSTALGNLRVSGADFVFIRGLRFHPRERMTASAARMHPFLSRRKKIADEG